MTGIDTNVAIIGIVGLLLTALGVICMRLLNVCIQLWEKFLISNEKKLGEIEGELKILNRCMSSEKSWRENHMMLHDDRKDQLEDQFGQVWAEIKNLRKR